MSVENRDWHREPKRSRTPTVTLPMGLLIVVGVIGGLVATGVVESKLAGPTAVYGAEQRSHSGPTTISLLPGLPGITIGGDALYTKNDQWKTYLADEQTCPGGERLDAPLQEQADTMACLVNYARRKRGLDPVLPVAYLSRSSMAKAERITRCLDFDHDACGVDAAADVRALGYRGPWGENLYIAGGRYGAPRPALDGWLNSRDHRENLFQPAWRTQGIAVEKIAKFGRDSDMTLWVNQFGDE